MNITPDLRLALPVRVSETGAPLIWAYHTPISSEVFTANYRTIAAAKHAIFKNGPAYAADNGPRIAGLALLDAGAADARETGGEDGSASLLAEIKRLTMILSPLETGVDALPVDVAIARGTIDKDDWAECEAGIVFFTLGFTMVRRAGKPIVGRSLAAIFGGSTTSLSPTEFLASLPTSTEDETTATKAEA